MPTCPGCQQHLPYDRLDTHYRYCHGLTGDGDEERRSIRRLESRVDDVERRLDDRLRALEVRTTTGMGDDEVGGRLIEPDW